MVFFDWGFFLGTNIFFVAFSFFFIGGMGMVTFQKNLIVLLIFLEMMLLGVNLNFIGFSISLDDSFGQMVALFVLAVAAAESAIGLSIFVIFYRLQGSGALYWFLGSPTKV